MSERWKYQIKIGVFWGLFMSVFMALYESQEIPLQEQLISSQFYFRLVFFLIMGIFILGYFAWRNKKF